MNAEAVHTSVLQRDSLRIECGSCSYICPAKRQLAQSIRATKKIEAGKKAAAAAAARAKAEAEKKAAEAAK